MVRIGKKSRLRARWPSAVIAFVLFGWLGPARSQAADEPQKFLLQSPIPHQVVQREGFVPTRAHEHEPGGPALGFGTLTIRGEFPAIEGVEYRFRVVPLPGGYGKGTDWEKLSGTESGKVFTATAKVPAGGWYRLEVTGRVGDRDVAAASVEPVGVGEVFVIAGQSYAEGANDEMLRVEDPAGRVVAYDTVQKTWRVANDPQPNAGTGGTIWPAMGDALVPFVRVPVGFVNRAVGGTSTRQWLPDAKEKLYERLAEAGKDIGRFRAVLWQQGESDVIEKVSTETYVKNMLTIRNGLAKEWGFEPPWLVAKSTLHPTVYNDPAGEGRIRAAIDVLWKTPGFRPGPDTDILAGENRGGIGTRRHFSGIGQRRAGMMWFATVWHELNQAAP